MAPGCGSNARKPWSSTAPNNSSIALMTLLSLMKSCGANAITPESEKTAHYFFAQAYNFKLDQPWISDMLARQVHDIFLEDMAMVKAQQRNMDLGPSPVVGLGQDKAWIAMRGIVERLIKEESAQARAA